jgi:hypothetical protein
MASALEEDQEAERLARLRMSGGFPGGMVVQQGYNPDQTPTYAPVPVEAPANIPTADPATEYIRPYMPTPGPPQRPDFPGGVYVQQEPRYPQAPPEMQPGGSGGQVPARGIADVRDETPAASALSVYRQYPPSPEDLKAAGVSPATSAILQARDRDTEPTVEGGPTMLGRALQAAGGVVSDVAGAISKEFTGRGTTAATSTSLAATVPEPAPAAPEKPTELTTVKGAPGAPAAPITSGGKPRQRSQAPDATEKVTIDPRAYVDMERTNKPLYDAITHVAATMDMSPWELTNMVYAASKYDPSYNKDGRIGLTGLTDADVARYQKEHPELFKDSQGNPVTAQDPYTNLVLGAYKYKELQDLYGRNTPSAIYSYFATPGRVNEWARMTPDQQKEHIPEDVTARVREAINPAAPDTPRTGFIGKLTDAGTSTAAQANQALLASARTGNPGIFASWQADNLPRGMSANDGWRHTEALMVAAMVAKGDMEGAQRARELVFQMSHVGASQSLMSAYQAISSGDYEGAAQQLARAYYFAPDGGIGKFYATPTGVYGQRFNEATRQPIGGLIKINPEQVLGMLNMTKDPQKFLTTLRESQKTNSDIEHKQAQSELARAQAKDIPLKREQYGEAVDTRQLGIIVNALTKGTGAGTNRDPTVAAQLAKEIHDYYPTKDLTGQPQDIPAPIAGQMGLWNDMKFNNPRMSGAVAKAVAKDLYDRGGQYQVRPSTDPSMPGWAAVFHKDAPNQVVALFSPPVASQFLRPAAPRPQSPIGATPAPAR